MGLAYSAEGNAGLPSVGRTGCDGLRPQLVALELVQISLHEAAGLDGLERHLRIRGTAVRRGGRRKETRI